MPSDKIKSINPYWKGISVLADDVNTGKISATEMVERSLTRIAEKDPEINALITVMGDVARSKASLIDAKIAAGEYAGCLAGVPFIAKDNFLVDGSVTTAASNILNGFTAPYSATAIKKLESEGAICVGKANLDAFAHGGSTENSDYFVTKNPHDITRVPGGSSGGSAAAVALDMAPFALGTDTGGSIRQPASYCGIVGFKPTYGLVSRSGVVAMAGSTDVIGPMTRSVEDAALVLSIMAGSDGLDSTTIDMSEINLCDLAIDTKKMRIGIVAEYMGEGVDPLVKARIMDASNVFREMGATVEEVSIPSIELALAVYYVVVPAELSSNLSRYDGQRYGFSVKASSLDESYELSRSQGFGAEAKRRIMIGTHVLSSGYYDAYYRKAQTVRTKLIDEFNEAFLKYDFLIGPVAPTVAFKIGQLSEDPLKMYLQDIMTVAANLVGIPAISIPCGVGEDSMPVGLQVLAPQRKDRALLALAKKFEETRA